MRQEIRFCAAPDGVRIAYATQGSGPAVVRAAHWLTHLEHDWQSPVWRPWLLALGRGRRVVRYDGRGCGLSDRSPERVTLEAAVDDLAAVADAASAERFVLFGASQGGATAIAYAHRHPERVSGLVLLGAYARGRMRRAISADHVAEADLLQDLIRVGWGRTDPVFRRVFTSRFLPGGTPEQMAHFDELQRVSASAEMALRLRAEWNEIDVTDLLDQIEVPTLVAHARADAVVPFEEGRLLATRIPGARFLPLESQNHVLMAAEPAWQVFLAAFEDFLGTAAPARIAGIDGLTDREREVLRLVAQGLSNEAIAQQLSISVRTVERHLAGSYEKLNLSGRSARAAAAALITRLG